MSEHLTLGDRLRALAASSHAECLPFVDREDIERAAGAVDATEGVSDEELNHLTSQGGLAIMLVALGQAERQFRWYGDLHAAKPDAEKAARNYEYADMLRALLPQTGEGEPKNKIVAGAEDALAFAQGDDTRASVANVRHLTLEEQQTVSAALARSSKLIHKPAPAPMSEGERDTLSDLEICNLALSRIAAEPISSLDENSPAARHCLELYAPTLDNLLRCGTWPYRPLLANALSWRLAADLASALKNDVTRSHEAMAEFTRALLANKEAKIAERAIADALSKREDG